MTGNVSFTGLNKTTTEGTSGTAILTGDNTLMMIPQSFGSTSSITISFTDKYGVLRTLKYSLNSTSWTRGTCVIYTINSSTITYTYLRNPLWYMAETNVKSYNSGTKVVTLEPDATVKGSASCWNWTTAMSYFSATHNTTQYDGYQMGDIRDSSGSVYTYHLPTTREFASITGFVIENSIFSSTDIAASTVLNNGTTNKCRFGYSTTTRNSDVTDVSYWSSVSSNVRYAIRFLGTDFCSVWRYKIDSANGLLIISAKLINKIETTETSKMATMMATITSTTDSYWAENTIKGSIQRYLYAVGYYLNKGNGGNGTADAGNGERWYYWGTTDSFLGGGGKSSPNYLGGSCIRITDPGYQWGYPIRLFRIVK